MVKLNKKHRINLRIVTNVNKQFLSGGDDPDRLCFLTYKPESKAELENGFSIDDVVVDVDSAAVPVLNIVSANTLWAELSDFTFKLTTNANPIAHFNYGSPICFGDIWGISYGIATHKVTGLSFVFTIYVERYMYELSTLFGFRSWFILQHYADFNQAFQPFLTLIEFDQTFTGFVYGGSI